MSTPWSQLREAPTSVRLDADDEVVLTGDAVDLSDGALRVAGANPRALTLRWDLPVSGRFSGDAWERGYGDLEWRGLVPDRRMPWYVLVQDGPVAAGFGVRTGGAAFAHWQVDAAGVELHLDLRNGTHGVRLGQRALPLPEVCVVEGDDAEDVHRELCRQMCPDPIGPAEPVYGSNDWYWAYSRNSEASILSDAELVAGLSDSPNRPFAVVDDGWQKRGDRRTVGPWQPGDSFGDMALLAEKIKGVGARPGLWMRPLVTDEELPGVPRLPHGKALDPSTPEALAVVARDVTRLTSEWGYELVKHDFSTFDVLGRFGWQMGEGITSGDWHLADRTRTTAEVLRELYRVILDSAGSAYVLGCNTVGHLAAGLEHLHRTGDDTNGYDWRQTRRMGPNTLAFRAAHHGALYAVDADCAPITPHVPWRQSALWLDAVARSGTATFISADPASRGPEEQAGIRAAFELAARPREASRALDWQDTVVPRVFRDAEGTVTTYDWYA